MCCCGNNIRDRTSETDMLEIGVIKIPEKLYLAIEVMNGRHGTGEERKTNLGNNYEAVQKIVNMIAELY